MAGAKGRSGGFRLGAGRKKKRSDGTPEAAESETGEATVKDGSDAPAKVYMDPKDFLTDYMNDTSLPGYERRQAATALMAFVHAKPGETGKKKTVEKEAKSAGAGRFSSAPPPKNFQ